MARQKFVKEIAPSYLITIKNCQLNPQSICESFLIKKWKVMR